MIASGRSMTSLTLRDGKKVLSVTLFNITDGVSFKLFHREGSWCSFSEDIVHGGHLITLRLDWGDPKHLDVVLDMDVYPYVDGIRGKKKRVTGKDWHQTKLSSPNWAGPRVYEVEFEGLRFRLIAIKSFASAVSLGAYIVDPGADSHK